MDELEELKKKEREGKATIGELHRLRVQEDLADQKRKKELMAKEELTEDEEDELAHLYDWEG